MIRRGLLVAAALGGAGCGASSLRLHVAPTLDTQGHVGVEAGASLALGWPLDYRGPSRHFVQARATVGAAHAGSTTRLLVRGDLDTLHLALPRLDVRGGVGFARRGAGGAASPDGEVPPGWSAAGWLALLPVLLTDEGGHPFLYQLAVGPELRAEALWPDGGGGPRGLFSLPLVIEANLAAIGD